MVAIAADARPTIKKIGNRSFFLLIFLLYLLLQRLTNLLLSLVFVSNAWQVTVTGQTKPKKENHSRAINQHS